MQNHILFLTLNVFSATGGIEKVSRIAGKALYEGDGFNTTLQVYSMHDTSAQVREDYFPATLFRGFSGRRVAFVLQSLRKGRGASMVILSHINLLTVGMAIKLVSPHTRVVLLAHGIEVWQTLPAWKRQMLKAVDLMLPVSTFTSQKMQTMHGLAPDKIRILHNCLDPLMPEPKTEKSATLLKKYGLSSEHQVLLTVTRISSEDRYKGYDGVIMAVKSLKKDAPNLRYLLVGQYDEAEKQRLDRLIHQQGLEGIVIFAGFVPDNTLANHFSLADVYIMPSCKEGFGIVFIEALYYGLPVIAGNQDGSVDALHNGKLGELVDPNNHEAIQGALQRVLQTGKTGVPARDEVIKRFGYAVYKRALWRAIGPLLFHPSVPTCEWPKRIKSQRSAVHQK